MQKTLADARAAGLKPQIYTHPIGFHGHGAGPIIGLYTKPGENIPGRGDYELFDDTCYAIGLNIKADIPEWANQEIAMYLEQTAAFSGGRVIYLGGTPDRNLSYLDGKENKPIPSPPNLLNTKPAWKSHE